MSAHGNVEAEPGSGAGRPEQPDAARAPAAPPARLKRRADFLRAASGGRVHARSFSLQLVRRPPEGTPETGSRVGLTVTKKVGNAVERNRIKRRLREALRCPGLPVRADHDYVLVARREALSTPFPGLVGEIRRCLADAGAGRAKASRPRPPGGPGPRRGKGGGRPVPAEP